MPALAVCTSKGAGHPSRFFLPHSAWKSTAFWNVTDRVKKFVTQFTHKDVNISPLCPDRLHSLPMQAEARQNAVIRLLRELQRMAVTADPNGDSEDATGANPRRPSRRLADKILVAFHAACDLRDLEVAEHLLRVLELLVTRRSMSPDGNRRRNMESLIAAHERIWHIKHPDAD